MKSLQWLRGWVSPAAVSDEFKDLQRYSAMSSSCLNCEKLVTKCEHPPPTLWEKLKDVGRQRTLKPFILIALQCFIMQFCGIFAMRPYIVQVNIHNHWRVRGSIWKSLNGLWQILNAYGVPLDANVTTVYLGLLGIFANIGLLATVKRFGKRKIYLWSMVPTFLSCIGLSEYFMRSTYSENKSITKFSHRILHERYLRFRIFPTRVVFVWSWAKCNGNDTNRDTNSHRTVRRQRQLHCDRAISDYAILHQHRRVVGAQHYDERNFSTQVRVVLKVQVGRSRMRRSYINGTNVFRFTDSQPQVPIDNSIEKVDSNLESISDSSCASRRSMFTLVRHYKCVRCESNSSIRKWILETASMECH